MHIVDVLVQSATAYSLILMVAAIVAVVSAPSEDPILTVSMYAVLSYGTPVLIFFSVRTVGVQILSKV